MMPMEIAPGIYDVGATDWIVRIFTDIKPSAALHTTVI